MGQTAAAKRLLSLRAQNLQGQANSSTLTNDQLAMMLGIDQIMISKAHYATSSTARSEVVSNLVLEFFANQGMDTEDASNLKRFVSPVDGGGDVRVYEQQVSAKLVAISVEHNSLVAVTNSLGLRKVTIS